MHLVSFQGVRSLERVDTSLLDECPHLRIVAKYGVGLDNIDTKTCVERQIAIGWTGGVNRLSVAEMALGFMLGLSRNLYPASIRLKAGKWIKSGGKQLTSRTIGIIGVGNIGKEIIQLLGPFQCEILVNDIIDQSDFYREHGLVEMDKETLLRRADIVTLHTPLTDRTHHLMNRGTFSMMRNDAFLINTARGPLVCEADLKWALSAGEIAGAAIDVYEEEPPSDVALLKMPNLFCTPHIGGNAEEAVLAMGRSAIHHVEVFFGDQEGA